MSFITKDNNNITKKARYNHVHKGKLFFHSASATRIYNDRHSSRQCQSFKGKAGKQNTLPTTTQTLSSSPTIRLNKTSQRNKDGELYDHKWQWTESNWCPIVPVVHSPQDTWQNLQTTGQGEESGQEKSVSETSLLLL